MSLPYLTAALAGIGGVLRASPEDFEVTEELPYEPTGHGDHVYAYLEKTDCTTPYAVGLLARALAVAPRDVGVAGMKDRRAVTRQWVSLPPPVSPEMVLALELPGVRVLSAVRHGHKLRTGHVRANHFTLVLRGVGPHAAAAAGEILTALAAAPGAPNWYGEQRFGRDGDNAAAGLALVRRQRRFDRDGRKNRLLLSALQSELFNRWLARRMNDGSYRRVLAGDLLRKIGGGVFASTEPEVDQARLERGEVLITGPMFGVEMRGPTPGSAAHELEAAVLAEAGIAIEELATVKKLAPGARREASVPMTGHQVTELGLDAIRVTFTLPAGAYATAVMREVQKRDDAPGPAGGESADDTGDAEAGPADAEAAGAAPAGAAPADQPSFAPPRAAAGNASPTS